MSKASIAFAKREEDVINYWKVNKTFEKTLKKKGESYVFYDGPPFCTGKPHHGHLLCSILKDIDARYQTMNGKNVARKWCWDTHGIPIEQLIMNQLNLKTNQDVMKYGIDNFNNEARKQIMLCKDEWRYTIERIGRWVDYENDCKTMDLEYMNSVWWAIKSLWDKGLLYQGVKVMPYSNACNTALSNFEAKSNYKDKDDPSLYVKFKLIDEDFHLLVWTTTPWTLPSNLAICVNENMNYCYTDDGYIIGEKARETLLPNSKVFQIVKGSQLVGKSYLPLWDKYVNYPNCHKIISDNYVSDSSGTGCVHIAPAFGEDDYRVALKFNIVEKHGEFLPPCPLDENGIFLDFEMKGKYCLDCNNWVIKILNGKGLVFKSEKIKHNYPFCWRTDTPLIYRIVNSWFLNVESIKDKLIEENQKIKWVPENIGTGRFGQWLAEARDWCISRSRYWGTPIPIWIADDNDIIVIGSIEELKELSGVEVTDLHREFIDHIIIHKNGKQYKRVEDVLDCWFESGSLPFAQNGLKQKPLQADFIAEGIDQCRGWFYTLLVLGVALFGESPYKTVKVSGLLLGNNGEKMSKSKKNYTEVNELMTKYTSDAIRLYITNIPASHGGSSAFEDKKLIEIVSNIMIPIYNSLKYLEILKKEYNEIFGEFGYRHHSFDEIDNWIIDKSYHFHASIDQHFKNHEYHLILPEFNKFIDLFSRWYIKLNKVKASAMHNKNKEEVENKIIVLELVLKQLSITIAPICPFLAEIINLDLKIFNDSIHLESYNSRFVIDCKNNKMDTVIELINKFREIRGTNNMAQKRPFNWIKIPYEFNINMKEILEEELNAITFEYNTDSLEWNNDWNLDVEKIYITKNLARETQQIRKEMGLIPIDVVKVGYVLPDEIKDKIINEILVKIIHSEYIFDKIDNCDYQKSIKLINEYDVNIYIKRE